MSKREEGCVYAALTGVKLVRMAGSLDCLLQRLSEELEWNSEDVAIWQEDDLGRSCLVAVIQSCTGQQRITWFRAQPQPVSASQEEQWEA